MTPIFSTLIFVLLPCHIFWEDVYGVYFFTSCLGAKIIFCCGIVSISAEKCDNACSKQRGDLIEICQGIFIHGDVKICSVGRAKGVILFCCTRTGCNIHCFIIINAFICWSPVCCNCFTFTLSLIWSDQ